MFLCSQRSCLHFGSNFTDFYLKPRYRFHRRKKEKGKKDCQYLFRTQNNKALLAVVMSLV